MAEDKEQQIISADNFDKLFGKDEELLNLRKEQVLAGAMYIIQQYYAETQNKMEVVAQFFGKKLDEEFEILYKDRKYRAYFRKAGLRVRGLFYLEWDNVLVALFTGGAGIVDKNK